MPDKNLERQIYKSYIKAIENSIDSKIFNSLYVKNLTTNEIYDVMDDGDLSCAYFVSGLLSLFNLIDKPHATVTTVIKKLKETGWQQVADHREGDVVVWEEIFNNDGTKHEHIGFALDNNDAVSNSTGDRKITKHHITYGQNGDGTPKRLVKEIYRYPNF
jgi:hypothetical protein